MRAEFGLLIGHYEMDIFGEASASPEGYIAVDFLTGTTDGGKPSKSLAKAITLYREALEKLCERHGVETSAFKKLNVRFGVDAVHGGHFTVTVEDQTGRRSVDQYIGMPGRRITRQR